MSKRFPAAVLAIGLCLAAALPARAADSYQLDPAHSAVTFKISHLGLSWVHGRFDDLAGDFTVDGAGSTFAFTIKTESVDTNNKKRDEHLSSPDFFDVKQFPQISFRSTAVEPVKDGLKVTGNLTLHGVTKPITISLVGGRTAEFPKGTQRIGYSAELSLKRSEFGMDKMLDAIGNDVYIALSFEGTRK